MAASAVLQHAHFRPDRLRAAREAAGLSLRDVSAATGLHYTIPGRFERGVVDPRASVLGVLAALYGVHPGDLFDAGPRT